MKTLLALTFTTACAFMASTAEAAQAVVSVNGNVATAYLHAARGSAFGGDLNGDFDTVDFLFSTNAGTSLTNISSGFDAGVPRPAGEPFTFRNRVLDQDPLDGGLGWNVLAPSPAITATTMQWAGGVLGGTIDTGPAQGPGLFLANLHFNGPADRAGGFGRVQLIRAGTVVAELPFIPEPASIGLVGMGMLGLTALRRRLAISHTRRQS
jgi:hypothetical protein